MLEWSAIQRSGQVDDHGKEAEEASAPGRRARHWPEKAAVAQSPLGFAEPFDQGIAAACQKCRRDSPARVDHAAGHCRDRRRTAGLWALRPSPTFSSGDLATGSSFDVTFRVENTDPRLTLFNLKISCILAQVRALPIEPTMVEATDVRFSGKEANNLAPGESGTFTCPNAALSPSSRMTTRA